MIFAGKKLSEQDIKDCYKAVGVQFAGQVVICDILLHCYHWEEIGSVYVPEAEIHHLRNFANWFLKRLGIIREDNLINMVRNFMGQDVPVIVGENSEKEKKE